MGGRPTRPIREQLTWNVTYKKGLVYLIDNDGELQCTLSNHWLNESIQFGRELETWEIFKECQGKIQQMARLETQLELDNTDARLIEILTRMSDWEEFEVFENRDLVEALEFEDQCLQDYSRIMKWEGTADPLQTKLAVHEAMGTWLKRLEEIQEGKEAASKQVDWINGQWPKVVAESTRAISKTPELQCQLEAKFRKQTHATFSAIQKLGGRPSHAVSPPDPSMDIFHKILYWSSKTSNYIEELLDWKTFLDWRRYILRGSPFTEPRSYRRPQFQSDLEFYAEFENFRLFQYDLAMEWLKCWQRVVRWHEEEGDDDDKAEVALSHLRDSERKVTDAATRLEKSRQEHTRAIAEHGRQIGGKIETECPEKLCPATPPVSGSNSPKSSRSPSSIAPYSTFPPSPRSSQSSQTSQSSPSPLSSQTPQSPPSPPSSQTPQLPPSPPSSQTSQSPASPLSSQTLHSSERLSKDRRSADKGSRAEKLRRRAKKEDTRKKVTKMGNTDTERQTIPPFSSSPPQAAKDDDIQMTDALEDPRPMEPIKEFEEAVSEDTVMTDIEDSPNHILSTSSDFHSTPATSTASKRSPSPSTQGPTSRKTRSTPKLEHALDGKILKKTGKKPSKKVKVFTEQQQELLLLNIASSNNSSMGSPSLRRSERLKEKAAASAAESQPLNGAQPSPSSGDKQRQKKTGHVEPSRRPSRKKNPKKQLDPLEPPLTPRQKKKLEMQSRIIESSRSLRQKKRERRARDAARPD
ncbi:MAG: hypothetical protein Q9161_004711 [Pseudevernia consocians]